MKKLWIAVASVAAVGMLVAGCSDPGSGTNAAGGGASTAAWPKETASLKGVELKLWAAQSSVTMPESVVSAFEKATGAKVAIEALPDSYETNLQTRVATGDKPDLAFWQPTPSMLTALNAGTNLQPLDGAPWIDKVQPSLKDLTGILNNTRYAALVTSPSVMGVYYNKKVFAANGITTLPKNFDEMVTDARKIAASGVKPFFEMGSPGWATQYWPGILIADAAKDGYWDKVNANKTGFTDPAMLKAITTYNDLIGEGLFNADITTATFEDQGNALYTGKAAMVVQVNAFFGQLQKKGTVAELNDTVGFFPISPSGNVATSIPDQVNALVAFKTGDATREAAAKQLLSFWLGTGYADFVTNQNTVSIETGVKSSPDVPQALLDVNASIGNSVGSMQSQAVANPDLWLNLVDMLNKVKTPQQVAEATQQQFVELAKASGAKGF